MELRDVELFFYIINPASEDENDTQVWTRVDIDQSSTFSFNLSQSDISDPTAVETGWSYQCSLPRTKNNEQVFSMIELLPANLVRFSSIRRTSFRLYLQGNLFQEGYFGLEEITKKEYKVRFYGGLGDFFYALDDIKINKLDNLQLKLGSATVSEVNSSIVYKCFSDDNGASSDAPSTFGFALTYQGQYDNFDSDHQVATGDPEEATWTSLEDNGITYSNPELNENRRNRKVNNTHYCGEYRSYYQRPMLKMQAIFEAIQKQVAKETDWTFELSPAFFNSKNPYHRDLWLVFSQLFTEQQADAEETDFDDYLGYGSSIKGINHLGVCDEIDTDTGNYRATRTLDWENSDTDVVCNIGDGYEYWNGSSKDGQYGMNLDTFITDYIDKGGVDYSIPLTTITEDGMQSFSLNLPFAIRGVRLNAGQKSYNRQIRKSAGSEKVSESNTLYLQIAVTINGVEVDASECPGGNQTIKLNNVLLSVYSVHKDNEDYRNRPYYFQKNADTNNSKYYTWRAYPENFNFTDIFDGSNVFRIQCNVGDEVALRFRFWGDPRWFANGDTKQVNYTAPLIKILKGGFFKHSAGEGGTGFRTGTKLTLADVIQTETTAMDFVLSYAKIFGLYFVKDDLTKTVTLMPRNAFYHGMRLDWTNKIDYSRDFTQTPCLLDYAKGTFALESIDGKYENDYKELYDKEYGAMVVNTGYELNREEKDYLEGNIFTRAVIARPYDQYFLGRTGIIYQDNKQSLYLQDSDGAGTDANMILVFRLFPATQVDTPFLITDDNTEMYINGFMWNEETPTSNGNVRSCSVYPNLRNTVQDDAGNDYSLYFSSPKTLYNDYDTKDTDNIVTIYQRCWQLYIQDQLNEKTKTLECYVLLQPHEVSFELFRYIIYINNTAWVLSEINGFNPLAGGATKCTLIRVNEETSYTQGQKLPVGNLIIKQEGTPIYDYEAQIDNAYIEVEAGDTLTTEYVAVPLTFQVDDLALELGGWELQYCTDDVWMSPSEYNTDTKEITVTIYIPKNVTFEERMFTVQILWAGCMGATIRLHQASASKGNFTITRADGTLIYDYLNNVNETILVDAEGTTETLTFNFEKASVFGDWALTSESYADLLTPNSGSGVSTAVQLKVYANEDEEDKSYAFSFVWADEEVTINILQSAKEETEYFRIIQSDGTVWYDSDVGTSALISLSIPNTGGSYIVNIETNHTGWTFSNAGTGATYSVTSGAIGEEKCTMRFDFGENESDRQIYGNLMWNNTDSSSKGISVSCTQAAGVTKDYFALYGTYFNSQTGQTNTVGIYKYGTGLPSNLSSLTWSLTQDFSCQRSFEVDLYIEHYGSYAVEPYGDSRSHWTLTIYNSQYTPVAWLSLELVESETANLTHYKATLTANNVSGVQATILLEKDGSTYINQIVFRRV